MQIKNESKIPKFKCNACGSCCNHVRGFIPEEDKKFLKENAFGKLPVVQLTPVERMTFPLWDWEAKRFMHWQQEAKIDARIKPLRAIFDLNSNKAIILTYFIDCDTDACPFLRNNKCSIYNTKRAYVCRLFPFNRGPFLNQEDALLKENLFGECCAIKHILPKIPDESEKMIRFLDASFPDGSFVNAVQNDIIVEWYNKTIVDLIRKKIIKPAINYPYNFLIKRLHNAERIDFVDFLVEIGYITAEKKKSLINRFDSNLEAKEKIKQYL